MAQLSEHELKLVDAAVEHCKNAYAADGKYPSLESLRAALSCGRESAKKLRQYVIMHGLAETAPGEAAEPGAPDPQLSERNEISKDKWDIHLPKTRLCSLEELLAHFKVDQNVWEVERFVINKWEMAGFPKAVGKSKNWARTSTEPIITPLYQIKAALKRKLFSTLEGYAKEAARLRTLTSRLQRDLNTERELSKRLALNHCGYDDFLANIKEFAQLLGDLSLPYEKVQYQGPQIVPAVKNGHSEDVVILLSDTHFGDRIRREDTSGFPEFDLIIGGNRMGYTARKMKQVLTLHRAMYPLGRVYLWIGGDIGNGILHDAPQSNDLFTAPQVHFSYHMIKFFIEDLLTLTVKDENGVSVIEDIELLFTVGNHMRLDEKMPHKYQAQRTLDWLIYQFVIEKFESHPKISIKRDTAPFIFETIKGHRHLFAHGMQVGYRNSPDAQNKAIASYIDRARALFDSPEWRRKNGLYGETFSRACIGDIHVPVSFPRFKSNGSLNGQNELGVNWTLEPIPAGQQIWGVSEKHQETWAYFLECTHVQRGKDDFNAYGMFAADYHRRLGR